MALQVSSIKQAYNCSQDELYAVSLLVMDSFDANQIFFLSKKTTYTVAFGTALRAQILAAKALPDFQQRGAAQESFKGQMQTAATTALTLWQELESFIRDSFPASEFKTRREESGSTHYAAASSNDWESVSQLMQSGRTFIGAHTAELTTGGMPAAFSGAFSTARTNFDTLYASFKGAEQTSSEQRDQKILANNAVHTKITNLCDDGKKYYRDDPAKRERFTFSKVLELISGSGSETISVTIPAGQSVTTDRVFANSTITNTGAIDLFVCGGSNACDVNTALRLAPGEQTTNTFGATVTITNNNAATEGQASLRVVR
jgi:hypothetical protein